MKLLPVKLTLLLVVLAFSANAKASQDDQNVASSNSSPELSQSIQKIQLDALQLARILHILRNIAHETAISYDGDARDAMHTAGSAARHAAVTVAEAIAGSTAWHAAKHLDYSSVFDAVFDTDHNHRYSATRSAIANWAFVFTKRNDVSNKLYDMVVGKLEKIDHQALEASLEKLLVLDLVGFAKIINPIRKWYLRRVRLILIEQNLLKKLSILEKINLLQDSDRTVFLELEPIDEAVRISLSGLLIPNIGNIVIAYYGYPELEDPSVIALRELKILEASTSEVSSEDLHRCVSQDAKKPLNY